MPDIKDYDATTLPDDVEVALNDDVPPPTSIIPLRERVPTETTTFSATMNDTSNNGGDSNSNSNNSNDSPTPVAVAPASSSLGKSSGVGIISAYNGNNNNTEPKLASIKSSLGWCCPLPSVKLSSWDPENEKQWKNGGGRYIANRNLLVSIPNLFCAFGVWLSWSVIASKIQLMHDEDPNLYPFQDWGSPQGRDYNILLYTLPAVAGLSGGTMRIANSFMTQVVGGRNVVLHSSICIAIPMIMTAYTLAKPNATFTSLIIAAWLSGIGGGAFASSMSNISFFYPKHMQGYSLGFNAGLGNFGVSMTQLLMPIVMALPFGKEPLSPYVDGWPNHAGWFWWPPSLLCACCCFIWMSNMPNHGNHHHPTTTTTNRHRRQYWSSRSRNDDKFYNVFYFYWMEIVALLAGLIAVIVLVTTRDAKIWTGSAGGKIWYNIIMVIFAMSLAHLFLWKLSPKSAATPHLQEQYKVYKNKHTYVMTFLYIMCFGSFIGFSSAFPKLITDLFGYITAGGCYYEITTNEDDDGSATVVEFVEGGTEFDCEGNGGTWGYETVTNPNAPNVFAYSWIGAAVGSLIRPFAGILADSHGGAKITQICIVWCTVSTVCLGFLVQRTATLAQPENNFGLFVFLFLNIFFGLGSMNGTTFRTIGVLFDYKLAGTVLGYSSAVASYGAFIIPAMFGVSISVGKPEMTLFIMAGYYAVCGFVNFWFYTRPGAERPGV